MYESDYYQALRQLDKFTDPLPGDPQITASISFALNYIERIENEKELPEDGLWYASLALLYAQVISGSFNHPAFKINKIGKGYIIHPSESLPRPLGDHDQQPISRKEFQPLAINAYVHGYRDGLQKIPSQLMKTIGDLRTTWFREEYSMESNPDLEQLVNNPHPIFAPFDHYDLSGVRFVTQVMGYPPNWTRKSFSFLKASGDFPFLWACEYLPNDYQQYIEDQESHCYPFHYSKMLRCYLATYFNGLHESVHNTYINPLFRVLYDGNNSNWTNEAFAQFESTDRHKYLVDICPVYFEEHCDGEEPQEHLRKLLAGEINLSSNYTLEKLVLFGLMVKTGGGQFSDYQTGYDLMLNKLISRSKKVLLGQKSKFTSQFKIAVFLDPDLATIHGRQDFLNLLRTAQDSIELPPQSFEDILKEASL